MAVRQLLKYKFHTIVAALCMAIGLTINGYWVSGELVSFDKYGSVEISKIAAEDKEGNLLSFGGGIMTGAEYKQIAEKGIEGVEKLCCQSTQRFWALGYTEKNVEQTFGIFIEAVSSNYFANNIENDNILEGRDSIGEGEIIIGKVLANRMFGEESPLGKSLTLINDTIYPANDFTGKSYKIVGVAKNKISSNIIPYVFIQLPDNNASVRIHGKIKSGYSIEDIRENGKKHEWVASKDGEPFDINIIQLYNGSSFWIASIIMTIFSLLIFVTGLISFMKFMIQMFYTRQRELALRKCMGSDNRGLYMLLACEVAIMLAVSFALSCITSELAVNYFTYMDLYAVLGCEVALQTLLKIQLCTTLIAMAISMVIILLPILKLRHTSIKGSILRHRQGGKVRYAMIGLQFAVSIIFFIVLGISLETRNNDRNYYTETMSKSEQQRIFLMYSTNRSWEEIRSELEKLPEVESFAYCNLIERSNAGIRPQICYLKEDSLNVTIIGKGDPKILELLNVKVQGNIVSPEDKNYVYVDKMLHERLLKEKDFDGTLKMHSGTYRVAGVIEKEYLEEAQTFNDPQKGNITMAGAIFLPDDNYNLYYYRLKEGVSKKEGMKAFEGVINKYIPIGYFFNIISTIGDSQIAKLNNFLVHISYLMAIISLLVVVLSIYSSISLDAATRQKEIAIRKINGARGRDIFKHFISPYIITYAVTFIIIYPAVTNLVGLAVYQANVHDIFPMSLIAIHCATVFVGTIALLAITSWHKIKNIMSINPADVIRKE